jgi:hypothetical protein
MKEKILYGTEDQDILEYDDSYDAAYDALESSDEYKDGDIIEIFKYEQDKINKKYKEKLYEYILDCLIGNYLGPDFGNPDAFSEKSEIPKEMEIETKQYVDKIISLFEINRYTQTKIKYLYRVIKENDNWDVKLINEEN